MNPPATSNPFRFGALALDEAFANREAELAELGDVRRSEDAHFSLLWDSLSAQQRALLQSLAAEIGRPLTTHYRRRHGLPSSSSVQRALGMLERQELVVRQGGSARISEPFLTEWLRARDT